MQFALLVRGGPSIFTIDEQKFLGFQSEAKFIWECLAGMLSYNRELLVVEESCGIVHFLFNRRKGKGSCRSYVANIQKRLPSC